MTSLASFLPAPKQSYTKKPARVVHSNGTQNGGNNNANGAVATQQSNTIPPYGQRQGWVPRTRDDFGDGGAFPEIHVVQYPLDMGRKKNSVGSKVVALSTDGDGRAAFDVIVQSDDKYVKTRHSQLVPAQHLIEPRELERPDEEELAAHTERTRLALEAKLAGKTASAAPRAAAEAAAKTHGVAPTFLRYTPAGSDVTGPAQTRIVKVVSAPVDPLEPPKFRHKKVTKGEAEAPVPIMHSPPRKVTQEDQQAWKIPPCISNWKNAKGYTIPLDKRLAADGRGLQEVTINDNFAKLAESLYVAESSAREEVAKRAAIQRKRAMNEKESNEEALRRLAAEARLKRAGGGAQVPNNSSSNNNYNSNANGNNFNDNDDDADDVEADEAAPPRRSGGAPTASDREREERERIRAERRRERERQLRQEAMGNRKNKLTRDEDRDVSEKIALGLQAAGTVSKETQYDQRLFNQTQGMTSGFGADDAYNVYDQPLMKRGDAATHIYRPRALKDDDELAANADAEYENLLKTDKFRPAKGFSGAEGAPTGANKRDGPVQFEKEREEDPFGLDSFLQSAKSGSAAPTDDDERSARKRNYDDIGTRGTLGAASAGDGSGSGRSNVDFERGDSRKRSRR